MNIHSLRSKITFIFFLAFLLLNAFFFFYIQNIKQNIDTRVSLSYEKFSSYFRKSKIKPRDIESYLKNFGFINQKNAKIIFNHARLVNDARGYQSFFYEEHYYYHVQRKHYKHLFKDLNNYGNSPIIYAIFAFILFLLLLVYLWLIQSLKPLQSLQKNISKFAGGDLSISCKSDKKDEIAIVANEFDNAVTQINLLLSSRQLFLRTVMHELKTPIAKGRIVSSLIEDEIQEKRLIFIFEKLEYLINDFAKIEEVISNNYTLRKQNYQTHVIIDKAIQMLLLDTVSEQIKILSKHSISINVDLDLLAMVLKNLLDNALKYSTNHQALVIIEHKYIAVISKGEPLKQNIENYFKPFHNEINMKRQGMGLGLYIIKSILDMHQMPFEYSHQEGNNIFRVLYS
ncbi:Two-component system histidine kinase RacS [hydrothermal vent metagenome]|uniref:histidine kinase n=1 Tax=hydrothermal vent metagenome TaxID=652676 RepID=A0A1W1D183_9ZZZZ